MIWAAAADTNSEKTNAYQTPSGPANRLNKNAAGMITTTYLASEIYKDCFPFPSPSNAPQQETDTADTMKPRLIMCSADTGV